MNNNIFVKLNKNKFNPDIEPKLNSLENERNNTKFNLNKTIYNPITGVIPQKINSQNDLILKKDDTKIDINSLALKKEDERKQQNQTFTPVKTKIVNNSIDTSTNNDYIRTYDELKNELPQNLIKENNYNNILDSLKELGIIKK
jgi:hypothetical protein